MPRKMIVLMLLIVVGVMSGGEECQAQTAESYTDRGAESGKKGEYDKAISDFTQALKLDPEYIPAYCYRSFIFRKKGEYDKAIADYTQALMLDPRKGVVYRLHIERGLCWARKGEYDKAIADYTQAIDVYPKQGRSYNQIAWIRATCHVAKYRDGKRAIEFATTACESSEWKNAAAIDTLAAGYAEAGDFEKAVKRQKQAIALTDDDDDKAEYEERLKLYKQGKPYRDVPKKK